MLPSSTQRIGLLCLSAAVGTIWVVACGSDREPIDPREINIDNQYPAYNDDEDEDICATSSGYERHECRLPEYSYEVVRNDCLSCEGNQALTDGDGSYYILWSKAGKKYRWEVDFVPVDGRTSRQMRFLVDEERLPDMIHLDRQPRSSASASFIVDLDYGDDICFDRYGKIFREKEVPGDESHPCNTNDAAGSNICNAAIYAGDNCKTIDAWLKEERNNQGAINIAIQDISYCYLQNRINKDVPSNQVDCADPEVNSSYFRTSSLQVPYILNHKGEAAHFLCSVTGTIGAQSGGASPIIRGAAFLGGLIELIIGANCGRNTARSHR